MAIWTMDSRDSEQGPVDIFAETTKMLWFHKSCKLFGQLIAIILIRKDIVAKLE
jgi:hypothetical protein